MKKTKKKDKKSLNLFKKISVSWSAILLFIILAIYTVVMLSVIQWGTPDTTLVYPYHMDEWHQFMGVTSLFRHLSNNEPGSSRGPMFFFIQAGTFLSPFVLLHVIHPSLLAHHFTSVGLIELHHIYILLRLYMLILGVLALILIYVICKKFLNTNALLGVLLFASTPLWITWSYYFKYDAAVTFWLVLSLYFLFRYKSKPTNIRFSLAGLIVGLTIATKISAAPLAALYVIAFLLFTPKPLKNIIRVVIGLLILCLVFALLGIPDILFLGKNWGDYIMVDIINKRDTIFGLPWYYVLLTEHYPIIFGHGLYFLIGVTAVYYVTKIKKLFTKNTFRQHNDIIFLASGLLIFGSSLITLEAGAVNERLFLVLPFIIFLVTVAITNLLQKYKLIFIPLLCVVIAIQLLECYTWVSIKFQTDPRVASSIWITQHIKQGTKIAIENPPIYQGIPNILLLDYYRQQSLVSKGIYKYEIIDKSQVTAPYAIVTNADFTEQFDPSSPKRILVSQLQHNKYQLVGVYQPDLSVYSYFGSERSFYFSGLLPVTTIDIYAKKR